MVRPVSDYPVGDIVAYRSRQLHVTVLHRIVAITRGGRYIFRGDNNSWRDPERVTREQLIGALWFAMPGLGGRPRSCARRRRWRSWPASRPRFCSAERAHARTGAPRRAGRSRVAARADPLAHPRRRVLRALVIALLRWPPSPASRRRVEHAQPADGAGTVELPPVGLVLLRRQHDRGHLRPGHVTTGQPIFTRLAGPVQVQFAYTLRSLLADEVRGTAALSAVVSSPDGWMRKITLTPPAPFVWQRVAVAGSCTCGGWTAPCSRGERHGAPGRVVHADDRAPRPRSRHDRRAPFRGPAPQLPFTLTPLEPALCSRPRRPERCAPQSAAARAFHPASDGSVTSASRTSVSVGPAACGCPSRSRASSA